MANHTYLDLERFTKPEQIDIDAINVELAKNCQHLTHLGIFYRQSELKFHRDPIVE